MSLPVHQRPFHAFLSYAHSDSAFVDDLYQWLSRAGLSICYDSANMSGGQGIGSGLQAAIEKCQGVLLIASKEAMARGWVKAELDMARVEQANFIDFRIVPLRIAGADVDSVLKGQSWIDVPAAELSPEAAAGILRSFYPGDNRPDPRTSRDVYFSASWRTSDNRSALAVSRVLCKSGFRLVGDARDQQRGFGVNRVESIIGSCGAFASVIPYRDNASASAAQAPYKNLLAEVDVAAKAGLPSIVIADPRVRRTDGDDTTWIRMDTHASECPQEVANALQDLWDMWTVPPHPHEVFYAVDLDVPSARQGSHVRALLERVIGMSTLVGNEIREADLQLAILQKIKSAFLVIADLTGTADDNFNLDVSIEAGMAIASGANLAIMAKGKTRRPPFMLRRAGQLMTYADEVEQLAVIHSIARDYRRRVINAELSWYN
jgi:hypothetical protein